MTFVFAYFAYFAVLSTASIPLDNFEEWPEVEAALRQNRCDVLLVSPKRLGNAGFMQKLLPLIQGSIGLFVVDEAHCAP